MGEETSLADGRDRRLDPRHVTVQRLSGAVAAAILAGLALIAVVVVLLAVPLGTPGKLLVLAGWLLIALSLALFTFFWPPVRHRHMSYRISEEDIQIRRGVLWRSISTVPRSRVQHTDVSQGPIERAFELSTLIVYTAGTQHASEHLPGLDRETALAIRDHLIDAGDDDAV